MVQTRRRCAGLTATGVVGIMVLRICGLLFDWVAMVRLRDKRFMRGLDMLTALIIS